MLVFRLLLGATYADITQLSEAVKVAEKVVNFDRDTVRDQLVLQIHKCLVIYKQKGNFSNSEGKKVGILMDFTGRCRSKKKVLDLELSLILILTMFIMRVLLNFMSWNRLGKDRMAS